MRNRLHIIKAAREFRAQAVQVFENIKTALASVGGSMDNVVRLVTYMTDLEQNADAYREVRASFFPNKRPAARGVKARIS